MPTLSNSYQGTLNLIDFCNHLNQVFMHLQIEIEAEPPRR